MSKSILVLEENSVVHGLVASALEMDGLTIHHEFNPDNYVERVRALSPDLVLISNADQRSGYRVCRTLKAGANGDPVPLVLLANSGDVLDSAELRDLRVDGVIRKPFEASDLQQQVSKHLNMIDLIGSAYEFRKSQSLAEEGLNPLDKMEVLDPDILGLLHEDEGDAGPVPEVDFSEELRGEPPPTLVMDVAPPEPPGWEQVGAEDLAVDEAAASFAAEPPLSDEEAGLDELGPADLLEEDTPEEVEYAPEGFDQPLDEGEPGAAGEPPLDQVEVEFEGEEEADLSALEGEEDLDLSVLEEQAAAAAAEPPRADDGLTLPPAIRRMMEMKPIFSREPEPPAEPAPEEEELTDLSGDLQTLTAFDLGDEFEEGEGELEAEGAAAEAEWQPPAEDDLPPPAGEPGEEALGGGEELPPLDLEEEALPPLAAEPAEEELPPLDLEEAELPPLEPGEEELPPLDAEGYGLEDEELAGLPPLEEEPSVAEAEAAEADADYGLEDEELAGLPPLDEEPPPAWEEETPTDDVFEGEDDVDEARVLDALQADAETAAAEETGGFDEPFGDEEDDRLAALETAELEAEVLPAGLEEEEDLALEEDEESLLLASLGDDDFSAERFDYDEMRPAVDAAAADAERESLTAQQEAAVAREHQDELRGLEADSSGFIAEEDIDEGDLDADAELGEAEEEEVEESWEGTMAAEVLAEEALEAVDAIIADEEAAAGEAMDLEAGDLSEELTDVELEEIDEQRAAPTAELEELGEPEALSSEAEEAPDAETLAALRDDAELTHPAFVAGEPEDVAELPEEEWLVMDFGPEEEQASAEDGRGEGEVPPVEAMMGPLGRGPWEPEADELGFTGEEAEEALPGGEEVELGFTGEDEDEVPPGMELTAEEVDAFAAGVEQDFGPEEVSPEEELVADLIADAEAEAAPLDEEEEGDDLDVTGALGSSFEDEFAALRAEIEANPEGERLDDILREREVQAAAEELEFDIPQHENTFTRAMGITDLPGLEPRPEAAAPAEPESPREHEPWSATPAPAGSLLDQEERARLSALLDEIITVSVRKAVQEEMPRLMERLMRENPTA